MRPHEILSAIDSGLSVDAQDWWNGLADDIRNEFIVTAQREGLDSAIAEIELSATSEKG